MEIRVLNNAYKKMHKKNVEKPLCEWKMIYLILYNFFIY